MNIEGLIKEVLDEITAITWSPGMYPQSIAAFTEQPIGAWTVATGTGQSTSTRRLATVETTVNVSLWCASAEARAEAKQSVLSALVAVGFLALVPSDAEVVLDGGKATAYVSSMVFRAWIDTATGWVYQHQNS